MSDVQHRNGRGVSENWDAVFRALAAEPRRQLVVSLLDADPDQSVPLPGSATMPTAPPDPERLRRELYHVHLPLLAQREYVTWERDPFVAARGARFDEVAAVFEALRSRTSDFPDSLVVRSQRLERDRQESRWD